MNDENTVCFDLWVINATRIKQKRDLLYQTFCFRDVLSIINRKKFFRKAIIVYDFENMCLATQEVFRKLKEFIKDKLPKVLYGGSVSPENITNLKKINNIDGFLIGGASQDAKKFIDIVKKTYS